MKQPIILIGILTMMLAAGQAQARDTPWYVGLKAGLMDAGPGVTDDAVNAGFDLGYRHNRYLSTEAELTTTVIDGETRSGRDWEVDTLSGYLALRSNTRVKLKGKVGLSHVESDDDDDLGLSYGIGIGFPAAGGLTEIEYTTIDYNNEDLDFFSIGVVFSY